MCGVLGALGDPTTGRFVHQQLDVLRHRGPDDRGVWESPDGRITLGHRRLSIIDLSAAGHQPMLSDDGAVALALNGEIYNYRELADELRRAGHQFRSESDTEVLLHAYLEWGRACIDHFVGMWTFALYDGRSGELWLHRDPFGIKPLYYVQRPDALVFASEVAVLRPLVAGHVDPKVAYDYLRWGHVDRSDATFVQGITRLGAGESLVVHRDAPGTVHRERRSLPLQRPAVADIGFHEAAAELRRLLTESVGLHMRSDVAIGSALSGGVDSSAIVMLMRELGGPTLDLHTFSYLAVGDRFDESRWVRLVAERAHAHRHDIVLDDDELPEMVAAVTQAQGEPFGSLSIVAQYAVFRAARQAGVTVMLDGQGADELFAGYPSFRVERLADLVRHGRFAAASRLSRRIADTSGVGGVARALTRAVPRPAAVALWRRWVTRECPSWLDIDWFTDRGVAAAPDARDLPSTLAEALDDARSTTSLPSLLRYEDRNSMAHSVESRVPYLTMQLAEFAATLPATALIDRDGRNKSLLVAALRGLVPDEVLDRRDKVAFEVPQQRWQAGLGRLPMPAEPASVGLAGVPADTRGRLYGEFVARLDLKGSE